MKILTVGFCSVVIMLGVNTILNISATNEVEQAIIETRPTVVEEKIKETTEKENIINNYNTYETNNYNETNNYYESTVNEEKLTELEDKIAELEKSNNDEEIVLIDVDSNGVVRPQVSQSTVKQDPWTGPKSYKCNRMAGYPAICGYCGEQGEIHYNIKEWQDTQGTYHLTHVGCGQRYCNKIGVEPRIEEAYKIR